MTEGSIHNVDMMVIWLILGCKKDNSNEKVLEETLTHLESICKVCDGA